MSGSNRTRPDSGLTLIELLMVTVILPVIVGAVGLAIFSAFSVQKSVGASVSGSGGLQAMSSVFYKDTESAMKITTSSSAPQCGPGTQLLGLEWNNSTGGGGGSYLTLVSYSLQPSGNGTTDSLVRNYCDFGSNPTPTTATIVSGDISPQQPPPIISPSYLQPLVSSGWVSASGVSNVNLAIKEIGNNLSYNLNSVPQLSSSSIVASAPSSPANVTASVSPGSATVSWTTSSSSGGLSITNYTVIATDITNPSNGGQTCSTTSTSCTVTGLTNGDSYTFSVVAVNAAGSSNPSVTSTPKTPTSVPGVVTGLSATGPDNTTQFTESWSTPGNGGLPITGYQLRYSTDNATWTTVNTNSTTSSYTVSPPSQTTYYVQVAAANADGLGPWSASDTVSWVTTTSYQVANYGYTCPSGGTVSGSSCVVSGSYGATQVTTGSYPIYTYEQTGSTPVYGNVATGSYYTTTYTYEVTGYVCTAREPYTPYACTSGYYTYGNVATGGYWTTTYTYEIIGYTPVYGNVQTGTGYYYAWTCPNGGTLSGSTCLTTSSYGATYTIISYSTDWNYAFRG